MKESILYLCTQEEPSVLKVLSSRYSAHVYRTGTDKELDNQQWKLVVFQDAEVWQQRFFQKLKKFPWIFVSTRTDIRGYITPMPNLFGVVNMGGANLSLWGIPEEMQLRLKQPVKKVADYYFFEQQPEICRIAYCPTGNSICENDFKLLSFVQTTNAVVTIISDQYKPLANNFPLSVKIVPLKSWFSVFKNAHIVIASGYNAINAMALCKPCIVLGDCGLGGMVTPANYKQLESVFFSGRKGACVGEMIPADLLEVEIRKAFLTDYKDMLHVIRENILGTYGWAGFSAMLLNETEQIMDLAGSIQSKQKRFALKPSQTSVFREEKFENKRYIMRGMQCLGESDEDMYNLLGQCDGVTTIGELIERNDYDEENATMLWENLYELWKEKLILFKI